MNLILPILFMIVCIILVLLPSLEQPLNLLYGILITLAGIPVYLVGIKWKNKPAAVGKSTRFFERFCQVTFNTIFAESDNKEA